MATRRRCGSIRPARTARSWLTRAALSEHRPCVAFVPRCWLSSSTPAIPSRPSLPAVAQSLDLSLAVVDRHLTLFRLPADEPGDLAYVASAVVDNRAFAAAMAQLFETEWEAAEDLVGEPATTDASAGKGAGRLTAGAGRPQFLRAVRSDHPQLDPDEGRLGRRSLLGHGDAARAAAVR